MSQYMLHIVAPSHRDDIAAIVGDLAALQALRDAVDDAIESGTGGASLTQSDGECYVLPVVRVADMAHVCTYYAFEYAPIRSERETVPVRAVRGMMEAIGKALELRWTHEESDMHATAKRLHDETLPAQK